MKLVLIAPLYLLSVPEDTDSAPGQQFSATIGETELSSSAETSYREHSRIRPRSTVAFPRTQASARAAPPKFYAVPHNRVAEEGETVRFQCAIAGHPEPWVTWEKDGVPIVPSSKISAFEREDLRVLEISNVTSEDSGLYRVILENSLGKIEATARLDVISHKRYYPSRVRARSSSPRAGYTYRKTYSSLSAHYGSNARFFYDIRSVPTPFLKWYKDGIPLEESDKYAFETHDSGCCLVVKRVTARDKGLYTLRDDYNGTELQTQLNVENAPPDIVQGLPCGIVRANKGKPFSLALKVKSAEPVDVIWMKDGCVISDCDIYTQVQDGELIALSINNVQDDTSGDYLCEIYNLYGEAMSRCKVKVNGKYLIFYSRHL